MHLRALNRMLYDTSTTGTGTVSFTTRTTRSAIFEPESTNINNAFALEYLIEDGANKETGVGVFTPGTPYTLTREIVYEKLENGTYTRFPATPLNLSGNARVGGHAGMMASGPFDIPAHPATYNLPSTHTYMGDFVFPASDLYPTVFDTDFNDLLLGGNTGYVGHFMRFEVVSPVYVRSMSVEITKADYTPNEIEDIQLQLRVDRNNYNPQVFNMLASSSIDVTTTGVKTVQLNGGDPFLLTPGVHSAGLAVVIDATSSGGGGSTPDELQISAIRALLKYKAVNTDVIYNNKSLIVEDTLNLTGGIGHETPNTGQDAFFGNSYAPFITFGY